MGILFDMAAFYRWLEQASDRELLARRDDALNIKTASAMTASSRVFVAWFV